MMRAREIMKAKGITARQLSAKLNISEGALSQQLNGSPSYKTMEQIASALEVPMWQLLASKEDIMAEENLLCAKEQHSADGLYCPVCGTELKLKLVKADE